MNINGTFFDFMGKRIFSIETPDGFVHFCDRQVFENVSDALRYIKGEQPPLDDSDAVKAFKELWNNTTPAPEELAVSDPVEVKE
jgi:hypothetical protein